MAKKIKVNDALKWSIGALCGYKVRDTFVAFVEGDLVDAIGKLLKGDFEGFYYLLPEQTQKDLDKGIQLAKDKILRRETLKSALHSVSSK